MGRDFTGFDWGANAADVLHLLVREAARIETPCGDGMMVWHRWEGPAGRTPLVMLHGGWGSWTHWIRTIPALTAERTVYAADLPGMGASANMPKPHTTERLSLVVAEGLEQLLPAMEPYHAVCFSFGGIIGAWVAACHGLRCKSLTLTGAAGFGDLHFVVEGIKIPDLSLNDVDTDDVHRENLRLLMFSDIDSIDSLAVYIHRQNIARGRIRTRHISLSEGLLNILPMVESPVGGIWGSDDATGGGMANILKRRDTLRERQPGAEFDIIKGAGHWVMYEAADQFNKVLSRHLAVYDAP